MAHHEQERYPEPDTGRTSLLPLVLVAFAGFGLIALLSPAPTAVKQPPPLIRELGAPGPVPVTERRPRYL
jgi:hypothetical protein